MLGQIVWKQGHSRRVVLQREQVLGLKVLRAELDPERFWAAARLRRACRLLVRAGTSRVLVPEGFASWAVLEKYNLRPVDPLPFLRWQAAALTIAALRRRGMAPECSVVALRGERVDRDLERAAQKLCSQVREVCISAPRGGEALRHRLHWEFGLAIRPDHEQVSAAVRFDPAVYDGGQVVLDLCPPRPEFAQVEVDLAERNTGDETQKLPLLAALWAAGQVKDGDLEFT